MVAAPPFLSTTTIPRRRRRRHPSSNEFAGRSQSPLSDHPERLLSFAIRGRSGGRRRAAGHRGDGGPINNKKLRSIDTTLNKTLDVMGGNIMKRLSGIALACAFAAAALWAAPDASGQTGWVALFDGKSLDGFSTIGDANWRVEGGAIVADKGNGYLISKNSYTDFQIRAEFWADTETNSGIFIRCSDRSKVTAGNSYEVNIWDIRPDPTYGTGAIVDIAKVDPMQKAGGKWNTYEITAKGDQFTIVLNGQKTVEGKDGKHASGPIALQHGLGNKGADGVQNDKGVVKFRKVEIKPL
jgi:3-keto-disaccharide hydrolase